MKTRSSQKEKEAAPAQKRSRRRRTTTEAGKESIRLANPVRRVTRKRKKHPVEKDSTAAKETGTDSRIPRKRNNDQALVAAFARSLEKPDEDSNDDDVESPPLDKERDQETSPVTHEDTPEPPQKKRTRHVFSPEEDQAIKSGVETIGKGKWKEIKSSSVDVLESRSPAQIKDRYRTLSKSKPQKEDSGSVAHLSPARPTPQRKKSGKKRSPPPEEIPQVADYHYPDRDCFDAALEVYNRKQLDGPDRVKRKCRIFVRRPVLAFHVKPCSECGVNIEDGSDYLTEFRFWLSHKLCLECMYSHLKQVVGTEKENIYSQLRSLRAEQPYPVAGYLQKHLHLMGIEDMVKHKDAQENEDLRPCSCTKCKCQCSCCWSQRTKLD